jgi:hypothetical protein
MSITYRVKRLANDEYLMYLYSVSTPHKSARSISRRFSLIIAPALLLCARDETIDWVEDGKASKM